LRINPPKFGGGLKFEPVDKSRSAGTPELGKRGRFAKVSRYVEMLYRQDKRNNPKKRAIHLNRPMKRLWRKVDNPTRPYQKIRFPAMPLLSPECIIFFC